MTTHKYKLNLFSKFFPNFYSMVLSMKCITGIAKVSVHLLDNRIKTEYVVKQLFANLLAV